MHSFTKKDAFLNECSAKRELKMRMLQNLKRYLPLARELVKRDLKLKYRRSVLGYLWSLLNPLLMMTVMTIVFSYMFRYDIPHSDLRTDAVQLF